MTDERAPTASSDEAHRPDGDDLPVQDDETPSPVTGDGGAALDGGGEGAANVQGPHHASGVDGAPELPPPAPLGPPAPAYQPSYVFLAVASVVMLALDLGSKEWAKSRLELPPCASKTPIVAVADHLSFRFACNQGGAWGLLQDEPESIRRPFFLAISVVAVLFIVSLYRKLTPRQWALRWGLPLVLGGALGNLVNRIQYNYVVDFIDYKAHWVRSVTGLFTAYPHEHWPTFNIADVAIVVGVGLMAVDMFTPAKRVALASSAVAGSGTTAASGAPSPTEAAPSGGASGEPSSPSSEPAPKET